MLKILIPYQEFFNEANNEFVYIEEHHLRLEHSLLAIRKWESKHHKPFLGKGDKTTQEILDYISCMDLDDHPLETYTYLTNDNIREITEYIKDPMTATTFGRRGDSKSGAFNDGRPVTAEIIYYWMISLGIPMELEKWHINQLMTLIEVINIKRSPKKKVNKNELARQRAEENARRRAKYNTKG